MATSATGSPTPNGIPTIAPSVDAPDGVGINSIVAAVDTLITSALKTVFRKSGTVVGTRRSLNLIEGTNVTLTVADDGANDKVDVTVTAANPAVKKAGTLIGTRHNLNLIDSSNITTTVTDDAAGDKVDVTPALVANPSITGNLTVGGTTGLTFSNGTAAIIQRAVSTVGTLVQAVRQAAGDTQDRFQIYGDGKLFWGSGAATPDVNLYRVAANTIGTDDQVRAYGNSTVDRYWSINDTAISRGGSALTTTKGAVIGETGPASEAGVRFGGDTPLYRASAGVLQTDGSINAQTDLQINGVSTMTNLGVNKAGTPVGSRKKLNVIDTSAVTFTVADNGVSGAVDVSADVAALSPSKLTGYPSDVTKELRGDGTWVKVPARELGYTSFTGPATFSAASEAAATTIVTAPAITFDGSTTVEVEFFTPSTSRGTATTVKYALFDGASSIGILTSIQNVDSVETLVKTRVTPSAGSHTFSIRGFTGTGLASANAGTGGVGNNVPGYIKVTTV
jgi:hypothetical protein